MIGYAEIQEVFDKQKELLINAKDHADGNYTEGFNAYTHNMGIVGEDLMRWAYEYAEENMPAHPTHQQAVSMTAAAMTRAFTMGALAGREDMP